MTRTRVFNRTHLAVGFILTFLVGWFSFAYYGYANQVLIVDIQGTIVDFEATTLALYSAKMDRNVKAVILYLNTPGGMAYPCLEIATYVEALAEEKPVIAVMGAQCTSGGYYIASFATHVYARENTLTGGVGVISVWVDLSAYYEQQGIKIWVWQKGEEKDLGADWRSPTEAENASIQAEVEALFVKLIRDVTTNRNETLAEPAQSILRSGGVVLGAEAKALGLVDDIGNLINAVEKTVSREMAGLWRFIIVTADMTETQKFLQALF
jgi:protease-4